MNDVQEYFKDICHLHEIVVVGDRYFTDILFGNRMGAYTIKTDVITSDGENFAVKLVCTIIL